MILISCFHTVLIGNALLLLKDPKEMLRLSLVCKTFYVCMHDAAVWREACQRVWGRITITCGEWFDPLHGCVLSAVTVAEELLK